MEDKILISQIKKIKSDKGYTLHELSKILDVQIATLERWLRTCRINRIYAQVVRQKLDIV